MSDSISGQAGGRTPYRFSASILQAFRMPGGTSLLLRMTFWICLLYLLIFGLFGGKLIGGYFEFAQALILLEESDGQESALAAISPLISVFVYGFLTWLFSWAVKVSAETAMHKNIFHGFDGGVFPLRFGPEEWRVVLAQIVVYVFAYLTYLAGYIITALIIGFYISSDQSASGAGTALLMLGAAIIVLTIIAMLFLVIRFSPAAALSVRDNENRLTEGWRATKGRFGKMLISLMLIYVAGGVIIGLVFMIFSAAAFGDYSMFTELSNTPDLSPADAQAILIDILRQPRVFAPILLGLIATIFFSTIWYMSLWGVPNYAAQLDQIDLISQEKAFS